MPETQERAYDPSVHAPSAPSFKETIDALTRQQGEDLTNATYLAMTLSEAKEFAARRDRIRQLAERLRQLEEAT